MQRLSILTCLGLAACGAPTKKEIVEPPPPVIAASDPGVVVLEGTLGNRFVRADSEQELLVRLRVDTKELERANRPRINLALAIDTSGSMEGDAIVHARNAASEIVDALHDGDVLSVVAFNSGAQTLVPSTPITADNRAALKQAIGTMKARGTTAMAQGLSQAFAQAHAGRVSDGVNRIVLLSDGVPNDEGQLAALADQSRQHGIAITALGLGVDYNETLLADISQRSGGTFHYVEKSEQVAEVFETEIVRLERQVARNLHLQMNPGPGVRITEVVGHQAGQSGRGAFVQLGNLSSGEHRDVYVRLAVRGRGAGAAVELLDVVLSFQDAVANAGSLTRDVFLSARATGNEAELEEHVNHEIIKEAMRAQLAAVVVQAIASARAGNLPAAEQLLMANAPVARKAAETFGDASFAAQADEMIELKGSLPSIAPQPVAPPVAPDGADEPAPAVAEEAPGNAPAAVRRHHDRAMETIARPKYRAR